jgi:hypothetical protein
MEIVMGLDEARDKLPSFCEANRRVNVRASRSLLANDGYERPWGFTISPTEIQAAAASHRGYLFPCVIGCVTYQVLPDKSLHQTAFIYNIAQKADDRSPAAIACIPIPHDVTITQDRLIAFVGVGGFAD